MFNRTFRLKNKELLTLFRDYAFALRGSLGFLGEFIHICNPVFRGLNLKPQHMQRWTDNLGKIVLLNGYTSTTLDKGISQSLFKGNCTMEFHFTRDVGEFEQSLTEFNKLWNGYYAPVDIQKLSSFPDEQELIIPPFYPVKILHITSSYQNADKTFHIILLVPIYINIGDGEKWTEKDEGQEITVPMALAYIRKLTTLVKAELITKVDLYGILNKCRINREREGIFQALGENSATNIIYGELNMLFLNPLNNPQKAWKLLSLAANALGNAGARIIAQNLQFIPNLNVLELGWNKIGDEGLECLSLNLKFIPKLRELVLYYNQIGDTGAESLIQHIELIPQLNILDLADNDEITEDMNLKMRQVAKENGIAKIYISKLMNS